MIEVREFLTNVVAHCQSAKCHNFPYIFLRDGRVAFRSPDSNRLHWNINGKSL
jgi:hypothetical protein